MAESSFIVRDEPDAADGTNRDLRSWHASHSAWLHAFLRRTLRVQPAEVEDIVQDTWLRVIRTSLAGVEHPRSYLSQVALNLFRDRRRRDAVRLNYRHLVLAADRDSIDAREMTEQEAARELEQLILDLPENVRDVFVLSRFRRMTNKEIATHLGISVKTVEWRIRKALEVCVGRLQG